MRLSVPARTSAALALVFAVVFAACTDGYPSSDAPVPDPHRLDQTRRLQLLNEAAAAAASEIDWRFELTPECLLRAERRGLLSVQELFVLPLAGSELLLRAHDGARRFEIVAQGGDGDAQRVFATRGRVDALRAELLLKLLRRDCGPPEGAAYNPAG
ncbi:hypothetical protein [Rubrivivax gelatinosus]|nr:hypothetical protein [Rubrivivax gelatinosus]